MKLSSLILITLFGISHHLHAQTTAIALRGGLNSTWLLNSNFNDHLQTSLGHTQGLGFIWYGLPYDYYSDRIYGLGLDVMLATHNQKWKGEITVPDTLGSTLVAYERTINMSYLDIPLYFRLAHDQGASYLEIGAQYSVLMSATESFSTETNVLPAYSDLDIKSMLTPNAWALMLGFGFDFPVSPSLFIAGGIRATYGFTDITKNMKGSDENYKPTKRANGGAHIALMYRFNQYHSSKAKVRRR